MDSFECFDVVGTGTGFHGFCEYHVAVVVVDDEQVVVAVAGRSNESTGLIRGDTSGDVGTDGEDLVASTVWFWVDWFVVVVNFFVGGRWSCDGDLVVRCWFCGASVLSRLVQMTFVHRCG